jgi:hypothetical protein
MALAKDSVRLRSEPALVFLDFCTITRLALVTNSMRCGSYGVAELPWIMAFGKELPEILAPRSIPCVSREEMSGGIL